MSDSDTVVMCMAPVAMKQDGTLDEEGLRKDLERLVEAKTGLFLASGGAGEAHVLTPKELGRVYAVGAKVGKGRVPVWAGLRESRSALAMYEVAKEAIDGGVDCVQLYQLDNGHGMIPTLKEQEAYWNELLTEITTPVAISIHYDAKFKAPVPLMQDLVKRYPQIIAVNMVGSTIPMFIQYREALPKHVKFFCGAPEFCQHATHGAAGYINPINNLIPWTCRSLVDAWNAGDLAQVKKANNMIQKFLIAVTPWAPSTARWVKMGQKILGTGNGVIRLPYLLPSDEDQQKLKASFKALGMAQLEIDSKAYVLAHAK